MTELMDTRMNLTELMTSATNKTYKINTERGVRHMTTEEVRERITAMDTMEKITLNASVKMAPPHPEHFMIEYAMKFVQEDLDREKMEEDTNA